MQKQRECTKKDKENDTVKGYKEEIMRMVEAIGSMEALRKIYTFAKYVPR